MRQLVLILHNVRSCHNVGAMLRTADGLGIQKVYLTGYTPYPSISADSRMPHIAQKLDRQIHKTALGAEQMIDWQHAEEIEPVLATLHASGYEIIALEQSVASTRLPQFVPSEKTALIVGREVEGIEPELLEHVDRIVEIPMYGQKESFNVAAAAAMALYQLTFAGATEK